ncbi:ABC transporter permease [Arcanobacterium pinnipediorum]|uniref:ABC transport system permease protein n=1 Tax=Arcanobacterium pinnipediorum TaxID=1503041 RepID=A0ABY5AHV1_9ACTO|nr:FtsX-like permease family protein [Arcanobacterium pinnipediorum]USR79779.1 hypothetical protein NG665_01955 [Arcanobacterium pinnipediorum]
MLITLVCSFVVYLGMLTLTYLHHSVEFSAKSSVPPADITAYNVSLPEPSFLSELDNLSVIQTTYSPTALQGLVITDSASAQLNIRSVPPKSLRVEDFYRGHYPNNADEIALPVSLAHQLQLAVGDEVLLSIPSVNQHGFARRVTVGGIYAHSPINPEPDATFSALSGMDMRSLRQDVPDEHLVGESGVLVVGQPGVSLADLKEAVLGIPGTVVITYNESYTRELHESQQFVSQLTLTGIGILVIPLLITGVCWYYSAQKISASRKKDYFLLLSLGVSMPQVFFIALAQILIAALIPLGVGILLGYMSAKILLGTVLDLPGSHFLLPAIPHLLETTLITGVLVVAIISIAVTPTAWNLASFFSERTKPVSGLSENSFAVIPRWILQVVLATTVLILLSFMAYGSTRWLSWSGPATFLALVAIAGCVTVAFFFHLLATHWFDSVLAWLNIPLAFTTGQRRDRYLDIARQSHSHSRLLIVAVASIIVVLTTHSSHVTLTAHIAEHTSPYDINLVTGPDNDVETRTDLFESAIAYPGIAAALDVHTASASLSRGQGISPVMIDLHAVDRHEALNYFGDDDVPEVGKRAMIYLPQALMAQLNIGDDDVVYVPGNDNRRLPFVVKQATSPWAMMELENFRDIQASNAGYELWLRKKPDTDQDLASYFVSFRSSLLGEYPDTQFRVYSGTTGQILAHEELPEWTTPILIAFCLVGIGTAVLVVLGKISHPPKSRQRDIFLLTSLGISQSSLRSNRIVEGVGYVVIDSVIGVALGLAIMPILWTNLHRSQYASSLHIPLGHIGLLIVVIGLASAIIAYVTSLRRHQEPVVLAR